MTSPTRRLLSSRRGLAVTALAVSAALGLGACGSSDDDAGSGDSAGTPVAGGTLKVAFFPDNAAFNCIDPFQVYWIEHRTVIRNLADSLTDQDPETGEIKPWLAESWDVGADGKEYTFHLRDGVTFSDGTPLDAEAVKANVDGWLRTVQETNGTAYGASYITGLDHAEVVDPRTVKFVFAEPNSSFLQASSTTNTAIISPASFENTPKERCLGDYVASGAFTLESYTPNELTRILKRDDYTWGSALAENTGAAHLDAVEFSYVAEDSVRTGNLVSGAVDIAWPRNPFTVEDRELIERSDATLESRPLPGISSTLFANVSGDHLLADVTLRKALNKAIDRETYARTIYGEGYPVVSGVFNSTTPYYVSQADALGHDPEGAKKLLEDAGWTVGADGYRHKDGEKLTIKNIIQFANPGDELIQDQLKQVGIDLVLEIVPAAERPAKIANGDYDLAQSYLTRGDPGVLQSILDPDLASSKALAVNAAAPEQLTEIKDLFATAVGTTDAEQSKQGYADLQKLLIDDALTFPLFERVQFAGVSNDVHGFAFTSESFLRLNDVWKQQ